MKNVPVPDNPESTPVEPPDGKPSLINRCIRRLIAWHVTRPEHNALPSQEVLAKTIGVSRTVLREALQTLQVRPMLEVRPRAGMRVVSEQRWRIIDGDVVAWRRARRTDSTFAADLASMLHLVLPVAAKDAATCASQAELDLLVARCDLCLSASGPETYREARRAPTRALLGISRNKIIRQTGCFAIVDGQIDAGARCDANLESIRAAVAPLREAIEQLVACETQS